MTYRRPSILLLTFLLAASLISAGCETHAQGNPVPEPFFTPTPTPQRSTYTVAIGNLTETLKLRGSLVSAREQPLVFTSDGTLKALKVAAGDQVESGQVLAELGDSGLSNSIQDAQFNLDKAKSDLVKLQRSADEINLFKLTRAQMLESVSKADLDRITSQTEQQRAELTASAALDDVKKAQDDLTLAENPAIRLRDSQSQVAYLKTGLTLLRDRIQGLADKLADGGVQDSLNALESALDRVTDLRRTVVQARRDPGVRVEDMDALDARIVGNAQTTGIETRLKNARTGLVVGQTGVLLLIPQARAEYDQAKSAYDTGLAQVARGTLLRAQVEPLQADMRKAETKLSDARASAAQGFASSMQEIGLAIVALDNLRDDIIRFTPRPDSIDLSSKRSALANAQARLQSAQEQLSKLNAGPSSAQRIAEINLQIAQLDAMIQQRQEQLSKLDLASADRDIQYRQSVLQRLLDKQEASFLRAPFPGVILSLDRKVGEDVRAFDPVGVLADPSRVQAEATVLEADRRKVIQGQQARVVLDPYPSVEHVATVLSVSDKPTLWQGQRAYAVLIGFASNESIPRTIRIGLDAILVIRANSRALVIPVRAITSDGFRQYVDVLDGGRTRRVEITTGSNTGLEVEVVNGLSVGQTIVLP